MGAGGDGQEQLDPMLKMFQGMMNSAGQEGGLGGGAGGDENINGEEIFKQFGQFLENSEGELGGEGFKGLLDSVVKDILSKDSLYKPMKVLKDEYPAWLENNWENVSQEDLERYNNQQDKVNEICSLFEKQEQNGQQSNQQPDGIFEKLTELQALGHPPEELMKKV